MGNRFDLGARRGLRGRMRNAARLVLVLLIGSLCLPGPARAADDVVDGGYVKLGFDRLASYPFTVPSLEPAADGKLATGEEQIPAGIKAYDGRKAVVTGFMLPVKMNGGLVKEFLLVKDPMMCCYGAVPNMNEWVVVRMKGDGVRPLMDVPVSLYGDLKIGAFFENGFLTGIYEMQGDRLTELGG